MLRGADGRDVTKPRSPVFAARLVSYHTNALRDLLRRRHRNLFVLVLGQREACSLDFEYRIVTDGARHAMLDRELRAIDAGRRRLGRDLVQLCSSGGRKLFDCVQCVLLQGNRVIGLGADQYLLVARGIDASEA